MKFALALVSTLVLVFCYFALVLWLVAMKHHVHPLFCCGG